MKHVYLVVFSFLIAVSSRGDQVSGRLINEKSGSPIAFAQVYVQNGDDILGTVSNEEGFFNLKTQGLISGELYFQSL